MRILQKGATNLHFSRVASSILIPPWSSRTQQILDDPIVWNAVTDILDDDGLPSLQAVEAVARMRQVDSGALMNAIRERLDGSATPHNTTHDEVEYRIPEYQALLSTEPDPDDLLAVQPQQLSRYEPSIAEFFQDIVLVEKLAETRALVGFTRIDPPGGSTFNVDWTSLALRRLDWLPAFRVFGEGIFVTLDGDRVAHWQEGADEPLGDLQRRASGTGGRRWRGTSPTFVLLHTLSHLLIRRLSFECGYGSSSLRERIYYSPQTGPSPMCGFLIYTAAGDAEGTLGGLVRQGRHGRFEEVLTAALLDACWCASDPLCATSAGQGTDSLNLAACHACVLLPETSCEEGNRLLDRMAVVGTGGGDTRSQMGYFAPLVEALLEASEDA